MKNQKHEENTFIHVSICLVLFDLYDNQDVRIEQMTKLRLRELK